MNPSTLHNSCKQKFYVMKCFKTKLFVQFQFLVNVCTKSLFAQTPSKSNVQQVQLVHTINKIIVFNMKIRNIIRLSYLIRLFLDTSFVFLLRLTMPFHLFESFHSNLLKLCWLITFWKLQGHTVWAAKVKRPLNKKLENLTLFIKFNFITNCTL